MGKLSLGFDLGGTKMLAAVVDEDHKVLAKAKRKTGVYAQPAELVAEIRACLKEALTEAGADLSQAACLGMAVPGVLDRARGRIALAPNLGLRDFPLVEHLQKDFPLPILLENDVNAGLWGEAVAGAAQGAQSALGVFVGTGIGGGWILGGRLHRGLTGNAGEIGHITIQPDGPLCGCGQRGHLEALAGRGALSRDAAAAVAQGAVSPKVPGQSTDQKALSSKFFAEALEVKDPVITELLERSIEHLGTTLAGIVNLMDPEMVLVGGGLVEKLGSWYLKRLKKVLRARAMPMIAQGTQIRAAVLGDLAGVVGAAALAREVL